MNLHLESSQAASTALHPVVHRAAAILFIWFVVAAWLLFGVPGYLHLALAMIGVLVFMVIAIPAALQRTGAKARSTDDAAGQTEQSDSWASWLHGEFSTATDIEKGSEATVEILLPIAAVAFGLTALGIVLSLVRGGVV